MNLKFGGTKCGYAGSKEGRWFRDSSLLLAPLSAPPIAEMTKLPFVAEANSLFGRLASGTATDFDRQLSRMWVWLGRAQMARDFSEGLLLVVIALEAGLCTAKEDKIRKTLADNVAIILSDAPDDRIEISARVSAWYDSRCSIVHMGGDHFSKNDYEHALDLAFQVACKLTAQTARWNSIDRLRTDLDRARLGKPFGA